MHPIFISIFLVAGLAQHASAQLAQTTTKDGSGNHVYVPSAGASTSSVAAPASTPTLVYNCAQMPLICENVAAWAIKKGNTQGHIPQNQVFYFDPDAGNKDKRRDKFCGCFSHDDCVGSGISSGKRKGDKVTDIAASTVNVNPIGAAETGIMKAGPNPKQGQQRVPSNSIPGRFFGQGVALTCDEFPAATFIEGGEGADTICAMQSWQVYSGNPNNPKNAGKWPLPPKTGVRSEQDWQATCHGFLRLAFGVSNSKSKKGWGTVYPFSFTTVTSKATSSKAWVVQSGPSTKVVTKRDAHTRTEPAGPAITMFVTGDEELDNHWFNHEERFVPPTPQSTPTQVQRTQEPNTNQLARAESPTKPFIAARTANPSAFQLETRTRPHHIARVPQALSPRASDCSIDFDKLGQEDVEVGDITFDPLLPEDISKPDCAPYVPQADVQANNDYLDNLGDDGFPPNNCCGGGAVECVQIVTNGTAVTQLCGGEEQRCIGCAMLANYVQGISNTCVKDGLTGGRQDINEAPGLSVLVTTNGHH